MPPDYSFAMALVQLKKGQRLCRTGWNGKGMWIELRKHFDSPFSLPYLEMKTVDDMFVPWLASQTDLLAEDWEVLERE